jgi:putative nucleotidyltransferase with HDIG domain
MENARLPRSLTSVGAALAQQVQPIARRAIEYVSTRTERDGRLERTLAVLVDRLCLSVTLAKPIGLVGWAEREAPRIGRAGVLDLANAAVHAIADAASAYGTDHQRLQAFLEVLVREIERTAIGAAPAEGADGLWPEGVAALLAMLAERDYGTCCHSKATAEWARRLATAMSCAEEAAEFIGLCALLHDVGKVSTPEAILLKPAALDEQEWEIMRDHAAAGARILNQIPSLQRCAMIVRAHHERFDGAGYPDGIAGISIPFEARVLAVADAFHAMISERPYRKPMAPREALKILEEGRGSQWDPNAVDAMLSMFTRRASTISPMGGYLSSA